MSPLPVQKSNPPQNIPNSPYSSKDLHNPLAPQDFPMSPELHTDPYSTSPQLVYPIHQLTNVDSAFNVSIVPQYQNSYLKNPQDHLVNPFSPEISSQENPMTSKDLLNPLISPLDLQKMPFSHVSSYQPHIFLDPNQMIPQGRQGPSIPLQKSHEDLNPLTIHQHLVSPSSSFQDLVNPPTFSQSSSQALSSAPDNRWSPYQVAGPRPAACSGLRVAGSLRPAESHGFDLGASPVSEMSRPGAPPPDVQRPPTDDGLPTDDPQQLYATLNDYLLLEPKFQPRLCLPADSDNGEVTAGARSGAAHVLRCLAVWFDLPPSVLFTAISLLDRFLTKMRVRPCHVACITVSCMNVALERARDSHCPTVTVEELVSVSQSACTAGDVTRMSRVIADKLAVPGESLTALHFLRLFARIVSCVAQQLGLPPVCDESALVKQLEIVVCDAACANARLSELALVLVFHKIEQQMVEWSAAGVMPENAYYLYELGAHLQQQCRMTDQSLARSRSVVVSAVSRYEASARAPHRQRLVWRLSARTRRVLRPTERLTSVLPTIEEQHGNDASPRTPNRNRSGSESSENGETSDWPRSPVLPVYCDN